MYDKRVKCTHCGKTLADRIAKNVVAIECTCGHITTIINGRVALPFRKEINGQRYSKKNIIDASKENNT